MAARRVRMVDVAEAAGVSRTTASFVLNGRDAGIPAETRQRVIRAARQMGYRPHSNARALATGRTQRLGIVLSAPENFGVDDLYFHDVLIGITQGALRNDYNLLLHSAHYLDWHALCSDILSGSTDGALLVGRYEQDPLTPALLDAEFPTVCVSYYVDHPSCYAVDCENVEGAMQATQHLLRLGHKRIAVIYPGDSVSWGYERLMGARRAMELAGLPSDNLQVFDWTHTALGWPDWADAAVEFLRTSTPRPTAALCCEEAVARRIVEALPGVGLRVPDDLAAVNFNSTDISKRARPPLTSVYQPLREIGAVSVDMLVALIEGRPLKDRIRRLPVRLDVRESCGALALQAD